jgi:hypothetical protein
VLKKWRELVGKYRKMVENDAPYLYTERALVGTLASAAWQPPRSYASLEEYSVYKSRPRGRGRTQWSGRADLWILAKSRQCVFEAKWKWQNIRTRAPTFSTISERYENELRKARAEAKKVEEGGLHLGLLFVTPYIPIRKDERPHIPKQEIDKQIKLFVLRLKEVKSADIAWTFPREYLEEQDPDNPNRMWIYPGVAVLIG